MALNFSDPQVKKIILEDSSKLTLSEVFSIPEFGELLEKAIDLKFLLKEVYDFNSFETERQIPLSDTKTAILTVDGILKVPTIDEEYAELICRTDKIFDFLKRILYSNMYEEAIDEKTFEKNRAVLNSFRDFFANAFLEYLEKKSKS